MLWLCSLLPSLPLQTLALRTDGGGSPCQLTDFTHTSGLVLAFREFLGLGELLMPREVGADGKGQENWVWSLPGGQVGDSELGASRRDGQDARGR